MTNVRIERAAHLRSDLETLDARLSDARSILVPVWRDRHFLLQDALFLPTLREAPELLDRALELAFLGEHDDAACFALDISSIDEPLALPAFAAHASALDVVDLRTSLVRLAADQAELAFYARGLLNWHARAQHCGVCGEATKPRAGGHVRVCARASCRTEHFPRTDPCVLVLVSDGERCVLGRQAGWPAGLWSTIAGFVEPGETLEDAVVREVAEETGVTVDRASIRYHSSQSWPFPASLMIGFHARATSFDVRAGDDLEAARWVTRPELIAPDGFFVPPPATLAGRIIAAFAAKNLDGERR